MSGRRFPEFEQRVKLAKNEGVEIENKLGKMAN